jgi:uncharacterized membrane protein
MHILLINVNPVVSRLFVLCTRDDEVLLDEVTDVASIENNVYDIVFVDETSYNQDVVEFLASLPNIKKVFISYQSDSVDGFDMTIKKPFLPSQIIEILEDTKENSETLEEIEDSSAPEETESFFEEEQPSIFPLETEEEDLLGIDEVSLDILEKKEEQQPTVLDGDEIEKIKSLLDMDDEDDIVDEMLSEEEIEAKKVQIIKDQLIAEGLEIVEENEIIDELSIDLNGAFNKKESKKKKVKKDMKKEKLKKKKSKKIQFTEKNLERIEDAVEMVMANMTKKQMKKLLKGKEIEVSVKLEDNN